MRSRLSASARHVLNTLGFHMDVDGRGCRVGYGTIAEETGLGRSTVIRTLGALDGEWVDVSRQRSMNGHHDANAYLPLIPLGLVSQKDYPVPERDDGGVTEGRGVVPERDSNSTKNSTENSVAEVFAYWVARRGEVAGIHGGPPMKPTAARLSKIRARLGDGYTVEHLREAIDGCFGNPANVRGGYTDIELICRNQQQVEQYRTWARHGPPASGKPRTPDPTPLRAPRDEL